MSCFQDFGFSEARGELVSEWTYKYLRTLGESSKWAARTTEVEEGVKEKQNSFRCRIPPEKGQERRKELYLNQRRVMCNSFLRVSESQ